MITELIPRRTRPRDLPSILELLSSSKLPTDGVPEHSKDFFVAELNGDIIGCVGLEIYPETALLRSLAVKPEFQSQGIGSALVKQAIQEAGELGRSKVVLLTETAEKFFERFGFAKIPRDHAPPDAKQSVEFKTACLESALCMVVPLSSPTGRVVS